MSKTLTWNEKIIAEFHANEGKVGGNYENRTLLLLHTTGAKSGKERINPLATFEDNGRYIVVAAKAGAPSNPDWYYNIVANPRVTVEVGTQKLQAVAAPAAEPERTELFAKMVALNPGFAAYEKNTTRIIPVVILQPQTSEL